MNEKEMKTQLERLSQEVAELKKLDMDNMFTSRRGASADDGSRPKKPKKNEKPDWVKTWDRQNASNGPVKTLVKSTETFHEATGTVESRTELVEPITTVRYARNLDTGEVEEVTETAGLPEHLRLDRLHEDRPQPIDWATRPTHGTVAPRGLTQREALQYEAEHSSEPPELRDQGPTKPVRKQMLRLNKVWKYRNFKKCASCEAYDTWESRVDPYNLENVGVVHAEIWCHTCGAVDFEVADNMPAHIGSWAPPKETPKQEKDRKQRREYRKQRTIYSLVESPKTAQQLTVWFREVEKYEAVDFVMIEIMLKRMKLEGLVVCESDGTWWESEDYKFEHPTADASRKSEKKNKKH